MSTAPSPCPYSFQDRSVSMPVVVRDAASMSATWLVDSRAARALLPHPRLDVVELLPGRALLSVACIDYRDNDLGDYDEVSIALFVRDRSRPAGIPWLGTLADFLRNRVATWIWWLPVNQSFTRDAGAGIWGFPKTVEDIRFDHDAAEARCELVADGRRVLTMRAATGGTREIPQAEMTTYTMLEGSLCATTFASGATGVGFAAGGAELELGDHPRADVLRGLGMGRRPLMTVWMERMRGRFDEPRVLAGATD
jgi:hypothetical protein